jgi:hypothetical protein
MNSFPLWQSSIHRIITLLLRMEIAAGFQNLISWLAALALQGSQSHP